MEKSEERFRHYLELLLVWEELESTAEELLSRRPVREVAPPSAAEKNRATFSA